MITGNKTSGRTVFCKVTVNTATASEEMMKAEVSHTLEHGSRAPAHRLMAVSADLAVRQFHDHKGQQRERDENQRCHFQLKF